MNASPARRDEAPITSADERAFVSRSGLRLRPSQLREPRVAGGRYWSGYWAQPYSVETIDVTPHGSLMHIVVRWEHDGRITSHFTAWNPTWDRIIDSDLPAGAGVI
jgi:hypothetical protein